MYGSASHTVKSTESSGFESFKAFNIFVYKYKLFAKFLQKQGKFLLFFLELFAKNTRHTLGGMYSLELSLKFFDRIYMHVLYTKSNFVYPFYGRYNLK